MNSPNDFLSRVWGFQPEAPHAFLAAKDWTTNDWSEQVVTPTGTHDTDQDDLYFAPVLFKEPRRLKQHACGGVWLFADLDEVDPRSLHYLPPQVAWETSPGRYQAMWRLPEPLGPKAWERLNRAITYRTQADKGGWSLTKVLRVPGTISTKHGYEFTVALVVEDWDGTTDAATVRGVCSDALPPTDPATGKVHLPRANAREIRREHWAVLSPRARKLIRTRTVRTGDDRSARLWELHNLCLDAGMTTGETVVVVRDTVWNKYKGQRRELRMLMQEATRAEALQRSRGQVPERRKGKFDVPPQDAVAVDSKDILPSVSLRKFMGKSYGSGGWLVKDIWDTNAFGWWAGEFKAYKTWTILDFAVSIASGRPFLGRYEVRKPGPVLYLHDEGRPNVIQDQLHRILNSKGMTPQFRQGAGDARHGEVHWDEEIPLRISTLPLLDLTDEDHRKRLLTYLRVYQPRAVILESWYLITGESDEKEGAEVNPLARWLMQVSMEESCAIIVSHHYNKGSGQGVRSGNRLSGSGIMGRIFESAVYLERKGEEEEHTVQLESQHRAQEGTKATIRFEVDRELDEDYQVHFLTEEEQEMMAERNLGKTSTGGRNVGGRPAVDMRLLEDLSRGEVMGLGEAAELVGCGEATIRKRWRELGPEAGFKLVLSGGKTIVMGLNGGGRNKG